MNPKTALGLVVVVVIIAVGLVLEAQRPREGGPPDLGHGQVPIGRLGHPLGSLIKIEGVQIDEGLSHGTRTLNVDTVDGKKLAEPVEIWIEHEGSLIEGKRYVIEGYENVRMIGTPPAREEIARRKGTRANIAQAAWSPNTFFVPLLGDMPTLEESVDPFPASSKSPFEPGQNRPTNPDFRE